MALTVREALTIGALQRARVLAGEGGLDNVIEYVDVMEVPDARFWLRPRLVEAACAVLGGEVLGKGRVTDVRLQTTGGFDVGRVVVQPAAGPALELDFWNEYAVCDRQGQRLATFPDLLGTFDLSSGLPLSSAEVAVGKEVAVVWVPRQRLILGAGMRDPDLMRPLEQAVGKEIVRYVF